jgi:hypothetical protein
LSDSSLLKSFLRPDQWERQRHMQQILEKEDHVAIRR